VIAFANHDTRVGKAVALRVTRLSGLLDESIPTETLNRQVSGRGIVRKFYGQVSKGDEDVFCLAFMQFNAGAEIPIAATATIPAHADA
jgi:hypothetical protein